MQQVCSLLITNLNFQQSSAIPICAIRFEYPVCWLAETKAIKLWSIIRISKKINTEYAARDLYILVFISIVHAAHTAVDVCL